jgi:predicted dehydrogenase
LIAKPQASIRLGIIGCGRVAEERHLPALVRLPQLRVVAAADPDTTRLQHLADRLRIAHRSSDYRALLDRSDVDAVAILTPTASHATIALAALEAGKHVLIEKPLALSAAECDELIGRFSQSAVKAVVCFNLRWHRLVRRARIFLASGALGRIKAIRSVYTHDRSGADAPDWHRKRNLGGGVTFNEGVHHFDLWRLLTGREVETVYSVGQSSASYEDETSVTAARLEGGIVASALLTFKTGPTSEIEIYGEEGRLCLSLYRFDGMAFFPHSEYPGAMVPRLKRAAASLMDLPRAIPALRRGGEFAGTFDGVWRHFMDSILRGAPSECTLEDGGRAVRVALAAVESSVSGLPVSLRLDGAPDGGRGTRA